MEIDGPNLVAVELLISWYLSFRSWRKKVISFSLATIPGLNCLLKLIPPIASNYVTYRMDAWTGKTQCLNVDVEMIKNLEYTLQCYEYLFNTCTIYLRRCEARMTAFDDW